ncbi:MAG: amidohydrolase family protein, partial [Acidobacteriota bacterium]
AEMTRELSILVNDTFAQICAKHPDRFRQFAAVSLINPDHGIEEIQRVKDAPGFVGIGLTSNVLGKMLDDPLFKPFFEVANSLKLTIFIHPVWRSLPSEWNSFRLNHLIGLPVDTTFSISHLALSGFFDVYPDLHMIIAHVGGAIPYLATRIERAYREGLGKYKPSYYFGKLYYDTAGPTHEAVIACVAKMVGSEQIVFGSDYPFGLGQEGKQYIEHSLSLVQESGLSLSDQENIFSNNVNRIMQ